LARASAGASSWHSFWREQVQVLPAGTHFGGNWVLGGAPPSILPANREFPFAVR